MMPKRGTRRITNTSERGAALLILMLLLAGAGLSLFLGRLNGTPRAASIDTTTDALARAKEALIAYAVTFPENTDSHYVPGFLPCPDDGSVLPEGKSATSCGTKGVATIGQLPWRTLGVEPIRDAGGNCLWYAVSGSAKANPRPDLLNSDSNGQFRIVGADGSTVIVGSTPASRPLAVIFSPGMPLAGQNRTYNGGECGLEYDASRYLDVVAAVNNAVISNTPETTITLAANGPSESFNDRLTWITASDVFRQAVERRRDLSRSLFDTTYVPDANETGDSGTTPALAQRVAECIALGFGMKNTFSRLPWAAPIVLSDAQEDTYQNDKFADANNTYAGRVPFKIWRSRQAIATPPTNFTVTWLKSSCTSAGSTSCRLFRTDHCPEGWDRAAGPTPGSNSQHGWWDKWKDRLFYAVAEDFQPAANANTNCTSKKCLYVNDNGPYAALVIYADQVQGAQSRATIAERNDPANYLEGINATAIGITDPTDPAFGKFARSGNDKFVCIKPDLTVDADCSSGPTTCVTQASPILQRMVGNDNQCRTLTGTVDAVCTTANTSLVASSCACAASAAVILEAKCLVGLNSSSCQNAIAALQSC